ncbi:vacuolar protein sorting-associated protein 11 [Trichodelitschia bisporula]|uniref:E3 ubiquitin-protein ligase PEP5 n=1 Tax=Trichodelitschia bisporula TaxID=703511 RepID=A0A6G1HZW1_9PEZI|nr:vacuolar protein sorting-associated protein 11 [Trichodelitschia bisporula]
MALTSEQWKAFKFFDVSQVKLADEENATIFDKNNITCVASGSENVFFGSADGVVHIVSQAFKIVRSFKAYDASSITHMKQVQGTSLLVTIGEDMSNEPVLKVWALDKLEKKTGIPRCQSTLSIQNGRKQFPISAFAALEDLSQLAIGFGNGAVTVVRGDLIHDRGARQRTVFETEEPITGIEFREGNITTLYIATTGRISTLVISGRGQGQPARSLDETGCGVGCMTVDESTRDVVVAREDGIYYYGLHGRGPVYAYEGPKKSINVFEDYIALISPPQNNTSIARTAPLRAFGTTQADDLFSTSNFTILNTDLKFIAHQEALASPVKFIFMEWGDLFLLTLDGKIYRYHEKSIQQKLELLYQRNLYVLAINLAQKLGVDAAQQNVIYRKYGDYLYQKQDYDTAMQQYLKAIDNTEPSQVIRKFLDTQRIHNLIDYLEELHEHQKATPDHTTLLLNCYAKLKDVKKLEEFIKSPGDLKFDLDTAIMMCRQGGYHDQAAFLARKHDEHELVVDILVEDSKKYAEALAYIWRLEPKLAYQSLMKYATVLLEHCSEDATQLFIDYYTGKFRPKKDALVVVQVQPSQGGVASVASAVQNLAAMLPLPYMPTGLLSSPSSGQENATSVTQVVETNVDEPPPVYDVPKPRTAFSAFVDHPQEFIVFLQACIEADDLKEGDKVDLYTTLFEMYLHTASGKKDDSKAEWENKAKALIESKKVPIDTHNVLLLSHLENFRDGSILVREKQGLRFDIFRSYTNAKDTAGAIKALHKYGPEEPQLYPAALAYFTSSPQILEEAGDELDAVLRKIDEDGLMAPLQVIQTLSTNGVATMGMIKKYLSTTIDKERQEISSNRRLIQTYRSDTEKKRDEIARLSTKPETFNATRCAACSAPLDLPAVHFLCKHSFHQRCLNIPTDVYGEAEDEGNVECPLCAPNNATVKAIKKAQEESAERHDMFLDALARSRDKFGTISEWFGRGVMSAGTEHS